MENLAMLKTICHTCLVNNVNPYEYLRDVLVRVRTHPQSNLDALLPMNWESRPYHPDCQPGGR